MTSSPPRHFEINEEFKVGFQPKQEQIMDPQELEGPSSEYDELP